MLQKTIALGVLSVLFSSPLAAEDLKSGSRALDFSALGADGKETKLSSRFGEDGQNVVLQMPSGALLRTEGTEAADANLK